MATIQENYTSADIKTATAQNVSFTTSNVALISNETPLLAFAGGYKRFTSFAQVIQHYASSTRTYKMLEKIFTNTQGNIALQNGSVFVFETTPNTDATQSSFATDDISANWTALLAITNGSFKVVTKKGVDVIKETTISKLNLTLFNSLAEFVADLNNRTEYNFALESGKIVITNPVFGAGYSIELEATTGIGTNLIDTGLITIASPVVVAGTNADITEVVSDVLPLIGLQLINNLASTTLLTTQDLDDTSILALATAIENTINFGEGTVVLKNIFHYALSSFNPVIETLADARNTDSLFKTFFYTVATKDNESLHNFIANFIAIALSRDFFKTDNFKRNLQGQLVSSGNDIILADEKVVVLNYHNFVYKLITKGVTHYGIDGSLQQTVMGYYIAGIDKISYEKKFFEYSFENFLDFYNASSIFYGTKDAFSIDPISQIAISQLYKSSILEILVGNKIILPYTGDTLPFTVTDGFSKTTKDIELQSMKTKGYHIQPLTITDADKAQSRLRFAFLLHLPSGLLKIESVGIAFE